MYVLVNLERLLNVCGDRDLDEGVACQWEVETSGWLVKASLKDEIMCQSSVSERVYSSILYDCYVLFLSLLEDCFSELGLADVGK